MGKNRLEMQTSGNGKLEPPPSVVDLPESRQAAWAQSMAMYQETAAHLDAARGEIMKLRSDIAGYRVALEAKDSVMADLESRIQTMQMVRDEAVAHRAKFEALFAVMQAQLRTFELPAVPFIKFTEEQGHEAVDQH